MQWGNYNHRFVGIIEAFQTAIGLTVPNEYRGIWFKHRLMSCTNQCAHSTGGFAATSSVVDTRISKQQLGIISILSSSHFYITCFSLNGLQTARYTLLFTNHFILTAHFELIASLTLLELLINLLSPIAQTLNTIISLPRGYHPSPKALYSPPLLPAPEFFSFFLDSWTQQFPDKLA